MNATSATPDAGIAKQFTELAPWVFQFRIGGADYGGGISAVGDVRLLEFLRFAAGPQRILELGSLEGAHTVLLAREPGVREVVAVEGRERNIRKAELVTRLLHVRNATFVQENLETADLVQLGLFDAVFCSGLLYHLPEPWKLIEQLPAIAPKLVLWTHYADDLGAETVQQGWRGRVQREGGADEPLSGMSATAFWLTLGSLIKLLSASGYESVHILQHNFAHPNGPAVIIGAATEPMQFGTAPRRRFFGR
ncbi:MAG: class I SAM-dependent methyltransferase [Chthoniobacterales bacterium]